MTTTLTLYRLADEYNRLMELIADDEQDFSVGISPEFINAMESLEGQIAEKAENICKLIRSMAVMSKSLDEESKQLALRAKRFERGVDELKDYLKFNLEQIGTKKITAGIFRVSICNNSQPSVQVLDLSQVPAKFDKPQERQVSLTEIRKAVESGEVVPGVDVVRGTHVRIS